jgi:hypothetical protein
MNHAISDGYGWVISSGNAWSCRYTCVTSEGTRRLGILVVAVLLGTGGVASAQRARAAANQPAKSVRLKGASASVKPFVKAAPKPAAKKEAGIPTAALLTEYQRVGRDLMLLANDRNLKIGVETTDAKLSCAELQATFRSIKITEATATPESRAETADLLRELRTKIERLRGVALTQECLHNPLAKDCT